MTQPVSEHRPVDTLFRPRNETPVRAPSMPRLAVVLASRSDLAFLRPALPGLVAQCAQLRAELIVVRPADECERVFLEAEFPAMRVIATDARCDLKEMRARGLAEASADITVLLDDRLPPSFWE